MGLRSPWTGTTAAPKCRRRPGTTRSRQPGATVLDVRNTYESDAGTFTGAVPLNTSTFVESWPKLDEALADVSRDEPVHMFCTGGVRCVKAGAYVKQKLGFSDVRRLEHGVVAYEGGGQRREPLRGREFLCSTKIRQTAEADRAGAAVEAPLSEDARLGFVPGLLPAGPLKRRSKPPRLKFRGVGLRQVTSC